MADTLRDLWDRLPATVQDITLLVLLLLPAVAIGLIVLRKYRVRHLVGAMLLRFRWTNLLFICLIAISVGVGVGLIAQERGLRQGTARAAEKFDLVITAPGSEVTMMLASVYLQPSDAPLLSGDVYEEVARNPQVSVAAPIAFGDSFEGAPVVGSTSQFVDYLSDGLAAGRHFETAREAIAGAKAPVGIGDVFQPAHGRGDAANHDEHEGVEFEVVGRMKRTGSPWDRAIIVPAEAVWSVHGLADGHSPDHAGQIGPPFDAAYFPGTPAVMVHAEELWANYALQSEFNREDTMAFFPGSVLAQLHGLLGDVRRAMSMLSILTQVLVAAGVLAGMVILMRLFSRRLALLRAIGSPDRFVFAVVWSYAACLIVAGAVLGIGVGYLACIIISDIISAQTEILIRARLGWGEFHLVAAFVSIVLLIALLPAFATLRRPIIEDLRG